MNDFQKNDAIEFCKENELKIVKEPNYWLDLTIGYDEERSM